MANATIAITLDGADLSGGTARYDPGATLEGRVQVTPDGDLRCQHILVRARWHTEGRGNRSDGKGAEVDVFQGELPAGIPRYFDFRLELPHEPWSYDGALVRIAWEVEASIDLALTVDLRSALPFVLRYAA